MRGPAQQRATRRVSRSSAALLLAVGALSVAACGQKGALYLPDSGGEVITRPMQSPSDAPAVDAPESADDSAATPKSVTPAPAPPATPPDNAR